MAEQALARQEHSDAWIRQRIDVNRNVRYGLEAATPEQLNVVYILAKRWQLDPLTDLTLYEGHPWLTVEGVGRTIRRHPDFRGLDQRPLTREERVDWGYEPDDIVIETAITTAKWGVIKERGKVTRAEIDAARSRAQQSGKKSAPIGLHPVEMATKRSLSRTARLAFGRDIPDEEEIEREVVEEMARRADPVVSAQAVATFDRIYAEPPELPMSGAERQLRDNVAAAFEEDSAEDAGASQVEEEEGPGTPPNPAPPDPWVENRRLYFDAVQVGLRPKTLRNTTPLEQVEAYNNELRQQIEGARTAQSLA